MTHVGLGIKAWNLRPHVYSPANQISTEMHEHILFLLPVDWLRVAILTEQDRFVGLAVET